MRWICCLGILALISACSEVKPRVFFRNIEEGARLRSPFTVEMGVEGMRIEPAGKVREGYGHHHILINQTHWPEGEVIPQSGHDSSFRKGSN